MIAFKIVTVTTEYIVYDIYSVVFCHTYIVVDYIFRDVTEKQRKHIAL